MFSFLKLFLKIYRLIIRKIRGYIILNSVQSHHGEIFVGGKTKLNKNTRLGRNPNFNGLIVVGSGLVSIGDNFHSGTECLIINSNHNYEGEKIPYDDTHITKDVIIEDNVWLGNRVTLLGGITIGEGAIIQAGSVVVKSVAPLSIVGGNPASVFKYRNREHYFKLKSQGNFH